VRILELVQFSVIAADLPEIAVLVVFFLLLLEELLLERVVCFQVFVVFINDVCDDVLVVRGKLEEIRVA